MKNLKLILLSALWLGSCGGEAIDAQPISGLNADKYLGTWHEIARLDHSFERGLSAVTANYSKRGDGGIKVMNRGCDSANSKWKEATGKAYFTDNETRGKLKVSFFGPFYGDYIIFDLDKDKYSYAYISGGSDKYLWLLSRTPHVTPARKADFIEQSKALGYDTDALIWVDPSPNCG